MNTDRILDAYVRMASRVGGVRTNLERVRRRREHARAFRDARRQAPWLRDVERAWWGARRRLRRAHGVYTDHVSNPGHAISLETAALLQTLLEVRAPREVLDLGSGFTSYVARLHQARSGAAMRVKSIDDSPHWMERTREYLASNGLGADALGTLEDLGSGDAGAYDVVCYDMGSMATRAAWLERALAFARPGSGVVILDDCHDAAYRAQVVEAVHARGGQLLDVRALTFDRFGRFAYLAVDDDNDNDGDGGQQLTCARTRAQVRPFNGA